MRMVFLFGVKNKDEKGTGVNDLPGAGQSRAPARPQAGESATLHQSKIIRTTSSQSEMGSDFALTTMISKPAIKKAREQQKSKI